MIYNLCAVDHYTGQCLPLTLCGSHVIVTHETKSWLSNRACFQESNSNLIIVFAIVIPYFTCYLKKVIGLRVAAHQCWQPNWEVL